MKISLIVGALAFFCSTAISQVPRRTLIEEFTSSSSDQSAACDNAINQFEGEAPGHFCIVKWYLPKGTPGGANAFYGDYTVSDARSHSYYGNDTVPRIYLNGGSHFDPTALSADGLRSHLIPEYAKTSPFSMKVTQSVTGDSLFSTVSIHLYDSTLDLQKLSIGVIVTQRYSETSDINHFPYHTNIVRTVLPSMDPKFGVIRDPIPFAISMAGQQSKVFHFATKIGTSWDRYGLVSVGVIQNNETMEVLQCNWTVPEVAFSRPSATTFIFLGGKTPWQCALKNVGDTDIRIYPQSTTTFPVSWDIRLSGFETPSFILKPGVSVTGTFISDKIGPFRESGEFIALLRTDPGLVLGSVAGTMIGNDSRDLIIKNWASSVHKTDADILAWKQFGLDAAICNEDALGSLFNDNLNRFRTIYIERSNYGNANELEILRRFLIGGGRLIFNSNIVNSLFSNSIIDTTTDKYAVNFEALFHTIPKPVGAINWTKGNVVVGRVFTDTLTPLFSLASRPVEPLVPVDTHLCKPLFVTQQGAVVGVASEAYMGRTAYLTFPISDINSGATASLVMGKILNWFATPYKVKQSDIALLNSEVYPNPASTTCSIHLDAPFDHTLSCSFFNEFGVEVRIVPMSSKDNTLTFDCSTLPSGAYHYRIAAGEKLSEGRIVVSR
ncbi:MAG: T9SS type A sorting domain-containing protein [bacterium]